MSVSVEVAGSDDYELKYTDKDMKIALRKLRDDILKVCENEAKAKINSIQLEFNKLKYSYELLLLEVEEYRKKDEDDLICTECKRKLNQSTVPSSGSSNASAVPIVHPTPVPLPVIKHVCYYLLHHYTRTNLYVL